MAREIYITVGNKRFMIERALDFAEDGIGMVDGRGWFLNEVRGDDLISLHWYETKQQAEDAALRAT